MNCPICGKDSKVVDSRHNPALNYIRRRRECESDHRFSSYEIISEALPLVELQRSIMNFQEDLGRIFNQADRMIANQARGNG